MDANGKNPCPVCKASLEFAGEDQFDTEKPTPHYWCETCELPFYMSDLMGFTTLRREGYSDEQVAAVARREKTVVEIAQEGRRRFRG